MNTGTIIISLDFELQWGSFDKKELNEDRKLELINTIELIPKMLALFQEYGIHATWASVGMLLNSNKLDWENNNPKSLPQYHNNSLSAYNYFEHILHEDNMDRFFFSLDTIRQINNTPNQEIGSHTYSHYYCLAGGQTIETFNADMERTIAIFERFGIKLNSLVFPRNQFNKDYLTVLKAYGLVSIRTNPNVWYWRKNTNSRIKRLARLMDTFFPVSNKHILKHQDLLNNNTTTIIELPSSRFLRSYHPKLNGLNKLKLRRILNEMTLAAKNKSYYHIWWHPENFGAYPKECLHELELILQHYKKLQHEYGFVSMTMNEYAVALKKHKNA